MKTDYYKSQALAFFRYFGDAMVYAFLPLFFKSLQLGGMETGTLLASVPLMAIVGNAVMSLLARGQARNLLLLKILLPIEAIGIGLIGFFNNFWLVLLLSAIINFCNSSFYSLLDGISAAVAGKAQKNYALIRIFGSIAYLLASFTSGQLIAAINYAFTFLIAGGIYLLAYVFLFALRLKDERTKGEGALKRAVSKDEKISKRLFCTRPFILYLAFYVLILSMSHTADSFFALYAQERGMSSDIYGLVYSSMIGAEIIAMLTAVKLRRIRYKVLLLFSAALLWLRVGLLCFDLPYFMLFVLPLLRGIGWGMLLAVHLNALKTFVERRYLTKAIFTLTIGLQALVAAFDQFGPSLVSATSYHLFFRLLFAVGGIGFIFLLLTPLTPQAKESANLQVGNQKDRQNR